MTFYCTNALDDDREDTLRVSAIHDDTGFRKVREILSDQYNLGAREPNVQVWDVDLRGDRSLTLRHTPYRRRPLDTSADEVLRHVARLWGFTARLETVTEDGKVELQNEIRGERRNQPAVPPARLGTGASAQERSLR